MGRRTLLSLPLRFCLSTYIYAVIYPVLCMGHQIILICCRYPMLAFCVGASLSMASSTMSDWTGSLVCSTPRRILHDCIDLTSSFNASPLIICHIGKYNRLSGQGNFRRRIKCTACQCTGYHLWWYSWTVLRLDRIVSDRWGVSRFKLLIHGRLCRQRLLFFGDCNFADGS